MKKRCLLPLFISAVLALGTSVPAFAQTLTLDTDGTDGYSGNVLMTLNTNRDMSLISNPAYPLSDSWEATGVPDAKGVSGESDAITTQSADDSAALTDLPSADLNLTDLAGSGSLQTDGTSNEYTVGQTHKFNTVQYYNTSTDPQNPELTTFTAECVAVTDHCTLWYDTNPTKTNYTREQIAALAPNLEAHAKIMEQTFGKSSRIDVDNDGKVAFVFYPFNAEGSVGVFDYQNLYPHGDDTQSNPNPKKGNSMDMLNINCYASGTDNQPPSTDAILSVLCHEWQHLINFSQAMAYSMTKDEQPQPIWRVDMWLNECFSQSAMGINGLENDAIPLQFPGYNKFMTSYGNTLTIPFAFKGIYSASESSASPGTYINWFLFGRYISAQTEGYTGSTLTKHTVDYTGNGKIGGSDAVYQSVLNIKIDDTAIDPSGAINTNIGYCTYESLETALTDMGYLGTGASAKAKDLNDMLRNFVIATTYRQTSGVYALGGTGALDLSAIQTAKLDTVAETPQKLPGGYSAAFTKIDGGSMTVDKAASGPNIEHVGITVNYDGVQADGYSPVSGAMLVNKGTQVSLSTTDTGTTILYTTDGTDPTATTGTVYTGPITIDANTTIKAIDTDQWGASSVRTFNYTCRSASATTVTIDGVKGQPITPQTLTISLTGDQFKNLKVGDDVTSLFPNLTPGLKATVSRLYNRTDATASLFAATVQAAESTETYDTMDVTISGTPTVTGEVDLTLSIPAQYLASGIAFTDVPLGTAKIDVTETAAGTNAATGIQSDNTPMFMALDLIAAAAALIIIAVPRKRKS
jgi:hypothetical protein